MSATPLGKQTFQMWRENNAPSWRREGLELEWPSTPGPATVSSAPNWSPAIAWLSGNGSSVMAMLTG